MVKVSFHLISCLHTLFVFIGDDQGESFHSVVFEKSVTEIFVGTTADKVNAI